MAGSLRNSGMRGGRMRRSMAEINVVPYIDVMLVLLIIFMVTAPLVTPGVIDLPSVARSSQAKAAPIEVIIKADKTMAVRAAAGGGPKSPALSEQRVTLDQLLALVRQRQEADAGQPVVIYADKTVQYEAVMKVMDALQKRNVKRVGLAVQPAPDLDASGK